MRALQLTRSYQVIALLRAWGGVTLDRLAADTGVTTRTIRRDLDALEAGGVPVTTAMVNESKVWRLVKGAPCPVCGSRRTTAATEQTDGLDLVRIGR